MSKNGLFASGSRSCSEIQISSFQFHIFESHFDTFDCPGSAILDFESESAASLDVRNGNDRNEGMTETVFVESRDTESRCPKDENTPSMI